MTSEIEETTNRLGALGLALADAQTSAMAAVSDLGPSASAALVSLGARPGQNIAQLAASAGVTHSVMVRTIERLEARGLVRRAKGEDRRNLRLSLSSEGTTLRKRMLAARRDGLAEMLSPLDDVEVAALGRLIDHILGPLPRDRAHGAFLCRLCDEEACGSQCPVDLASASALHPLDQSGSSDPNDYAAP